MRYLFLEDPIYGTPKNHLAWGGSDSNVEHDRCEDSAKDETINLLGSKDMVKCR
jgi:hypothetical protein